MIQAFSLRRAWSTTVDLGLLLAIGHVAVYGATLTAFAARGGNQVIDGVGVALMGIEVAVVSGALLWIRGPVKPVALLLGTLNLIFYVQRPLFLILAPESHKYTRFFGVMPSDTSRSILFITFAMGALFLGLAVSDRLRLSRRPSAIEKLDGWFEDYRHRTLFYVAGLGLEIIHLALVPVLYVGGNGHVVGNSMIEKILLTPVVYLGPFLYIPFVLALKPSIRMPIWEKIMLGALVTGYVAIFFLTSNKDAAILIPWALFIALLAIRRTHIALVWLPIGAVCVFALMIMFPLHHAVKFLWFFGWDAAVQDFARQNAGLAGNLVSLSERLAGVDWITAAIVRWDDLHAHLNIVELGKEFILRFIPIRPLFPDHLPTSAVFPVVVRGVSVEATSGFGEYPTLLGWAYIAMGPIIGILFLGLVGWGLGSAHTFFTSATSRSILLAFGVWDLVLGGDLVEITKSMVVFAGTIGLMMIASRIFIPRAAPPQENGVSNE